MKEKLKNNENSGITLIALVVTIVVLLILAGITINMLFSENGIITKAREAAEKTAKAEENDIKGMENVVSDIDKILNEVNKGQNSKTITEILAQTQAAETNQNAVDVYGNKILIPAGFKIVPHGTDGAEYTYSGDNVPAVQDGIVIENEEDKNQFVWIPVGTIKNKDNTTTTIQLGRYSDFTMGEDGTLPTPAQVASKTDYDTPVAIDTDFFEVSNNFAGTTVGDKTYEAASSYGNTKAYNLQEWITTTLDNGGYYIARYEASQNETKAASKAGQTVWASIPQLNATIAAKETYAYSTDAKYYSDLMNSYAWDTAIIFIEAYADSTYASKNNSTSFGTTGKNNDKVCNIHDMSGNAYEWTTETSTSSNESSVSPCVGRGGLYHSGFRDDFNYTSYRLRIRR